MIPRFKPAVGAAEWTAAVSRTPDAVPRFEREFASHFGMPHGVSFAYGRYALFVLCRALGLEHAEVVLPAYTCSVVAYAVTLSGNTCRFVDVDASGYNMDLEQLEGALTERTRMVIATHLFGIPADVTRIAAIVSAAERRFGHKIWVVQDCAHAFGARWKGSLVCQSGDVALFGLGVSKMMTSIAGGMLTTNDAQLADQLRRWRGAHAATPSAKRSLAQAAYLAAVTAAFSAPAYGFVRWLESETSLLDSMTRAYHMDGMIRFPPDHADGMSPLEARIGLAQLARYDGFERTRQQHARFYFDGLRPPDGWTLPPAVDGATYSHFPVLVPERDALVRAFVRQGIQLGQIIDYSVPHLKEYAPISAPDAFPNSYHCSRHVVNLPVHPGLSDADRARVVEAINRLSRRPSVDVAYAVGA